MILSCTSLLNYSLFPTTPQILLFLIVPHICHAYIPPKYFCPPSVIYQPCSISNIARHSRSKAHSLFLLVLKAAMAISFSCFILVAGPWPAGLSPSPSSPLWSDCRTESLFLPLSHLSFITSVVFWLSFVFSVILHHSFLHLDVIFPERVRTASWIILAASSSVPFSPSSGIPSSDNIFRIAHALQVIIKPFIRPHFTDAFSLWQLVLYLDKLLL